MNFKTKYTTTRKKQENQEKEKDKVEISEESYAIGELLQEIVFKLGGNK